MSCYCGNTQKKSLYICSDCFCGPFCGVKCQGLYHRSKFNSFHCQKRIDLFIPNIKNKFHITFVFDDVFTDNKNKKIHVFIGEKSIKDNEEWDHYFPASFNFDEKKYDVYILVNDLSAFNSQLTTNQQLFLSKIKNFLVDNVKNDALELLQKKNIIDPGTYKKIIGEEGEQYWLNFFNELLLSGESHFSRIYGVEADYSLENINYLKKQFDELNMITEPAYTREVWAELGNPVKKNAIPILFINDEKPLTTTTTTPTTTTTTMSTTTTSTMTTTREPKKIEVFIYSQTKNNNKMDPGLNFFLKKRFYFDYNKVLKKSKIDYRDWKYKKKHLSEEERKNMGLDVYGFSESERHRKITLVPNRETFNFAPMVFFHEVAHTLFNHGGDKNKTQELKEFEAESVAIICIHILGPLIVEKQEILEKYINNGLSTIYNYYSKQKVNLETIKSILNIADIIIKSGLIKKRMNKL